MILIWIYPWNLIVLVYFFHGGCFFIVNIKISCYDDYTMFKKTLNYNLKLAYKKRTWMSSIHTNNMYFFHVLILKIFVIYSKPSLIIVLRKSKCMCMSYNIINPQIEIYEWFNELKVCAHVYWCIVYFCFYKI